MKEKRQKTLDDMEPILEPEKGDDPFYPIQWPGEVAVRSAYVHALRVYDHLEERRARREDPDPLF